jgi:putative phosphoesterase
MVNDNYIIAVISDIHGNSWALEAVLRDIKQRHIDKIVNLGDSLYGPLDPAGTFEQITDAGIISISGNEDEILFKSSEEYNVIVNFVKNRLTEAQLNWLKELPDLLVIEDEMILFHGSPTEKQRHFLEIPGYGSLSYRSDKEIEQELSRIKQPIVLCGHSHLPDLRRFSNGRIVLNPGSVGLQAFIDDHPEQHYVENGSPHARYSILKKRGQRWLFEKVDVPYDWETASRVALNNGRLDWADWLRTGRVSAEFSCCVS